MNKNGRNLFVLISIISIIVSKSMKLKKNTIIENVIIQKIWYGWIGIATHESGRKILVKHALPDSVVTVKIFRTRKDYVEWTIVSVQKIADERMSGDVKCPHYTYPYHKESDLIESKTWCGWCRRQVVAYDKQLVLKQSTVDDAMKPIIDRYQFDSYSIVPSPQVYQYRNKIEFSFGKYMVRSDESRIKQKAERKEKQRREDETHEEYLKRREEMRLSHEVLIQNPTQDVATLNSISGSEWQKKDFSIVEHRQMGFHRQWEFSKVVDVKQCFLVSEKMHRIYDRIKSDLKNSWIPVYDAKQHTWCLRHLVMREWVRTDQMMINLAISDKRLQSHAKDQKKLDVLIELRSQELAGEVTTMVMTINNGLADIVHGRDSTIQVMRWEWVIYEGLQFEDTELLKFQVSPFSFFQTNTLGAEELFAHAKNLLEKSITGNIIDLYCGSGTIGLSFLAQWVGKSVYGIEVVESAVTDAERNAKINGMANCSQFFAGKAEKLLLEWVVWEEAFIGNDLVIIDPPRSGLHSTVVRFLRSMKAKYDFTLLYISCNPVTMERDLQGLLEWWVFSLSKMQAVDMFPQTHHVELIGMMK